MVPLCFAKYSRPSGPNCREVGLTELAFLSKLLPKLIGAVVWAHKGFTRSSITMLASIAAVTSARMRRTLFGALVPRPSIRLLNLTVTNQLHFPLYRRCSHTVPLAPLTG